MPVTMSDNRKYLAMSEADADGVMSEIARLEIEEAREKAIAECRIARIKSAREERKNAADARIRELAARLDGYIHAHESKFKSPRARITDWGRYGMRDVTSIQYRDEEELLKRLTLAGRDDLLKVERSLDTTAIKQALASGEEIEGVIRITGERTFYKTSKSLLDRAAETSGTVTRIIEG